MIVSERADALKWTRDSENEGKKLGGKIVQKICDRTEVTMLSGGG